MLTKTIAWMVKKKTNGRDEDVFFPFLKSSSNRSLRELNFAGAVELRHRKISVCPDIPRRAFIVLHLLCPPRGCLIQDRIGYDR